jgi:hypothetical protein
VLAKIKGTPEAPTPPGVKGISLFIVPRYRVGSDGVRGERNGVVLAGLIHKMGYRGTVSTMLNFGEDKPCVGYLVGARHRGLAYMFQMMNEARICVGLGGAMLGYAGYLASLDYARGRTQGRPAGAKDPEQAPVRLVEHADIRRMLLTQKAYVEGALALCLTAARLVDDQKTAESEAERRRAGLLLDILTPVVKAWPAEYCLAANNHAIQILGGYGYTRDYPVEQLLRDNRLNAIHEGTNGIQALDLLGRKVRMENGAAFRLLCAEIRAAIAAAGGDDRLAEEAASLADALDRAEATTETLIAAGTRDAGRALANASTYLDMTGRVVIGWIWLRQALAASAGLGRATVDAERDFYRGKLQAARWFSRTELPQVKTQAAFLASADATAFDMHDEWF